MQATAIANAAISRPPAKISKQTEETKTQAFGKVLEKLSANQTAETTKTAEPDQTVSLEKLEETLNILQKEDVLELENGLEWLAEMMGNNEDLMKLVEGFLEITPEQLQSTLVNLMKQLNLPVEDDGSSQLGVNEILQTMNALSKLAPQELAKTLNPDALQLIKGAKFLQLLLNQSGSPLESSNFDDQDFSKKLSSLVENVKVLQLDQPLNQLENRHAFLKQTFKGVMLDPTVKITGLANKDTQNVSAGLDKTEGFTGPIHFQQMSRPEQLTLTLSVNGKPVSTEQLIKQFESLLARSQFTNVNGVQKLSFNLNPGHLGSLRIELTQQDSMMVAKILTSSNVAKETIEGHLNQLKQALTMQNVQVDRIEIATQLNGQERFLNRDGGRQQQEREEAKEQKDEQRVDGDYKLSFAEALLNTEEVDV